MAASFYQLQSCEDSSLKDHVHPLAQDLTPDLMLGGCSAVALDQQAMPSVGWAWVLPDGNEEKHCLQLGWRNAW